MDLREQLSELNRIGAALSSERNLSVLLGMILTEARRFTNAEGGTLYTCEKGMLRFELAQNELVPVKTESAGAAPSLRGQLLPASKESLSGYCAVTGESLNIPDAYAIPDGVAYRFNNQFDKQSGYRTQSLLVLPLKLADGEVIGVLQLINARDETGKVIPFESQCEDIVRSLASQAAVAYRNAKLTQALKDAYMDTILRLCNATEFRDQDTAEHIRRMSRYSAAIAEAYGLPAEEVEAILYASPMHDIGKVGIPDAILLKPGKLTPEEFEIMKRHTLFGAAILEGAEAPVLQFSREIALTHHEKFNGSGYPNGLKGTDIPIAGRIVAIADVFDALTSERCYKAAFPVDKAVLVIADGSGTHFDPECVTAFLKALDRILQIKRDFADNKAKAAEHHAHSPKAS